MAPHETGKDAMEPLRLRIDEIDLKLVELLNARADLANEIGRIKKDLGLPIYAPSREKQVLANVMDANGGPLPESAVRRLFERVIDETRTLERRKYQDPLTE